MTTRRIHGSEHEATGLDPVVAQDLSSNGAPANQIIVTDGAGGWTLTPAPSATTGLWSVPITVVVGDLVYATAVAATADKADYGSVVTARAVGIVIVKPTAITATVVYNGEVTGFLGLTPGDSLFVGAAGAFTAAPPAVAGQVVAPIGDVKDATTIVLDISKFTVLLS